MVSEPRTDCRRMGQLPQNRAAGTKVLSIAKYIGDESALLHRLRWERPLQRRGIDVPICTSVPDKACAVRRG